MSVVVVIGKTSLLKKAFENEDTTLNLFVTKKNEILICEEFKEEIEHKLQVKTFGLIVHFKDLFQYLMELSETRNFTLIIDEIQMVPEFEKTLRSLLAEGGYDIYCTGSNAHILSGELGTYLGGRYIEIPVYALSFPEFLIFHKLENTSGSLDKYLKYGGLPYLIHLDLTDETVLDYLKNISQSILFRDVVSRFEVRNVGFLVRLIKYLAKSTTSTILG